MSAGVLRNAERHEHVVGRFRSVALFTTGRLISPFSPEPYEYRPLHFDHSPTEVRRLLREAGFRVGASRAASLFRIGLLKRRIRPGVLAGIERPLQAPLGRLAVGPSVYLRARRTNTEGAR